MVTCTEKIPPANKVQFCFYGDNYVIRLLYFYQLFTWFKVVGILVAAGECLSVSRISDMCIDACVCACIIVCACTYMYG